MAVTSLPSQSWLFPPPPAGGYTRATVLVTGGHISGDPGILQAEAQGCYPILVLPACVLQEFCPKETVAITFYLTHRSPGL